MQSSAAPSPPRPPRSARPEPRVVSWRVCQGLGSRGGPVREAPHLGQHVAAVPRHSVLLLVQTWRCGRRPFGAGPRAQRLLASQRPPEQVLSREARVVLGPRHGPPPSWQAAGSGPAQACLPPYRDWSPLAPPQETLASAPGPRWGQTHGTWPQPPGSRASVPGQIKGAEGRARALPVGAACGVAGPWSVGGPVVATRRSTRTRGPQPAWPMSSAPSLQRQAGRVVRVPHCLLKGVERGAAPAPTRACPEGSSDPGAKGHLRALSWDP